MIDNLLEEISDVGIKIRAGEASEKRQIKVLREHKIEENEK